MDVTDKLCPSCQRPLPADAPAGLCPVCALMGAHPSAPPVASPSLEQIRAAFPQFEILECIGNGGMGVVYKVRQPQLDRLLALKILLPGLHADPGFAIRFEREARVLAKLDHPNIVAVHDFGQSADFCWLTMSYVEGVNLRQAMQAAKFTPRQALDIIPPLCAALQYAHDHGVLHRDIKPENILLGAAGGVKIVDFGIAMLTEPDASRTALTMTGAALGSTVYAAPEQIEKPHQVDHRADLYSLGVVLYEMLTGELPLGRFPAPSEKSATGPSLDRVVFRTLEKEPDRRYQSAAEVQRGVETASRFGPSKAREPRRYLRPILPAPVARPKVNVLFVVLCVVLLLAFLPYLQIAALGIGAVVLIALVLLLPIGSMMVAWHRLWMARRGMVIRSASSEFLGAWVPVVGAAVAIAIYLIIHPYQIEGKGSHLVNVLAAFGVPCAVGIPLFWLAFPRQPGIARPRAMRWVLGIAFVLDAAVMVDAKRQDGHWPYANFYGHMDLTVLNEPTPEELAWLRRRGLAGRGARQDQSLEADPRPENPLRTALVEAGHAFGGEIVITTRDVSGIDVAFLAPNEGEWCRYARALLLRLESVLPAEEAVRVRGLLAKYVDEERGDSVAVGFYSDNFRWSGGRQMDAFLMFGSSLSGVLAAWCLARRNGLPLAVFLLSGGVMLATPVWVRQGDREAGILQGTPPLPPEKKIVTDFSTPVAAAQSVFDAAWAGKGDIVKTGLSHGLIARLDAKNSWEQVLPELSSLTWVRPVGPELSFEGDPKLVKVQRSIHPRNGFVEMIFEDGIWKIAGFRDSLISIP